MSFLYKTKLSSCDSDNCFLFDRFVAYIEQICKITHACRLSLVLGHTSHSSTQTLCSISSFAPGA